MTEEIRARIDTLPEQPADQFQTGVTRAVRGTLEADPGAGDCDSILVVGEAPGTVISGRLGIGVSSVATDRVIAQGALAGVAFLLTEIGSAADPPSVSTNAAFISDDHLTVTICDDAADGEDPPARVRFNALYTVSENVTVLP